MLCLVFYFSLVISLIPVNVSCFSAQEGEKYEEHSPLIGFDCNQTEPEILSISALKVESCPEISKLAPVVTSEFGQIIQKHNVDSVKIITCQLTKSTFYFKCGKNWLNYQVYPPSIGNLIPIRPEECSEIHTTRSYRWASEKDPWTNLIINSTHHFSANEIGWTDSSGYCEGGSFSMHNVHYKDTVVQVSHTFSLRESWGMVDYETNTLNIERTTSCPFLKGSCYDALSGTHSWIPKSQKCPDDKYRLLYQGPLNLTKSHYNPRILLSVNNPPFLFTSELGSSSYVCGSEFFFTEFPNIFYVKQRYGMYQLTLDAPSGKDIEVITYLNAKMTFLYHDVLDSTQKMYLTSLRETCKVEREMLKNRIEIIRLNSAAGGLSSLLKPGMFAKANGEVIHLIKCKPVAVKFRQTELCYDALPITHDNQPQFLLPITHIISPFSSTTDCSPITPLTYMIGGQWWSYTGTYQQVHEPKELTPSTEFEPQFTKIKSFSKGGMYSQEQVDAIQRLLIFPQLREAITTQFARGVSKFSPNPVKLDLTNVMSQADWRNIIKSYISNMWGYFAFVGNGISGCIGLYVFFKIFKGILNCLLNCHDLYKLFGCSLQLMSAGWTRLAQYIINSKKENQESKKPEEEEMELQPVDGHGEEQMPTSPVIEEPVPSSDPLRSYMSAYLPSDNGNNRM